MCGIVAVLRQPSSRPAPDPTWILRSLEEAEGRLAQAGLAGLEPALGPLQGVDVALRGTPGLRCLLGAEGLLPRLAALTARIGAHLSGFEADLDQGVLQVAPSRAGGGQCHAGRPQGRLVGDRPGPPGDGPVGGRPHARRHARHRPGRLVVHPGGAGLARPPRGAGPGLRRPARPGRWTRAGLRTTRVVPARAGDDLFESGSVRAVGGCLSFVYKAAAEIGELGDNVKALRAAIRADALLARALAAPAARTTVIGHTRWASVGHHLRGQRPPPELRGAGPARRPLRGGGPQWRCRQPRRPASGRGPASWPRRSPPTPR